MTDIAIQTKDLKKSYEDTKVLKGVDLHVDRSSRSSDPTAQARRRRSTSSSASE